MRTGYRARIGLVAPEDWDLDDDCYSIAPPGVTVHTSRHRAPSVSVEALLAQFASGDIEDAARRLAMIRCHAVGFACVSCSFAGGPGYDRKIVDALEKLLGCPATSGMTAFLTAMKAMDIGSVAVVTPYDEPRNELFRQVLGAAGVNVVNFEVLETPPAVRDFYQSLGFYRLRHIRSPEVAYRLGKKADCPEAQAIVIGSTNFHTGPMIEPLEQDLGKPVITGNQATMWHSLRLAGIQDSVAGYGRLLQTQLR
jgi:maleate isomerase